MNCNCRELGSPHPALKPKYQLGPMERIGPNVYTCRRAQWIIGYGRNAIGSSQAPKRRRATLVNGSYEESNKLKRV